MLKIKLHKGIANEVGKVAKIKIFIKKYDVKNEVLALGYSLYDRKSRV